ncbi:MAG: GNAT family N-acetyltransferase [Actinobacteria bacterium]|nr:GNAT family N-acetyltransferase [Actinomycetota bacterium]
MTHVALAPFDPSSPPAVTEWVTSAAEAEAWAGLLEWPLPPGLLDRWHELPDVLPFVLLLDGVPAGYAEIWLDVDENEAELARIVVNPAHRGRGNGRAFVRLLAAEAERLGLADVWLRVVPENAAAISCYRAAGFVRAAAAEEESFNAGQPRRYVWMRYGGPRTT